MFIKSEASPDELNSPFYIKNQELCLLWEKYILERGGKITGSYSCSAYIIKAKVKIYKTWVIDVKKASYTSGNLLLSSKYQSLQEHLTFKTLIKNSGCCDFYIKNGEIRQGQSKHPLFQSIKDLLIDGFKNNNLNQVRFEKEVLSVVFHYQIDWFEMVDKILDYRYP